MRILHSRRTRRRDVHAARLQQGGVQPHARGGYAGELPDRDPARAEHGHSAIGADLDNRRFDANTRWPAVDDSVDAAGQVFADVACQRRARSPGPVGARRRHRAIRCGNQPQRNVVGGHAHAHGGQARRHARRDGAGRCRQHHRQRPGPKRLHKPALCLVHTNNETIKLAHGGNMYDQRIVGWPPLCGKYRFHRFRISRICTKTIYRLRRKGDRPT
ncbi:hypothetical protein D3C78_1140990 [compost metagenome]